MNAGGKLPVSQQLVGVTAVVVFATSAVSAIGFVRAIAGQWQALAAIPRTWSDFYYPIVSLPVFYVLLAILSVAMFASLLLVRRSALVTVCVAYLAVLFLALAWRFYIHFPAGGLGGLRFAPPLAQLYFGLRIFYAIWLVGLSLAVLPNNLLKRAVAE